MTSSDQFESRRLDVSAELVGFSCGEPSLDDWLVRLAQRFDAQDAARVYVWTEPDQHRVLAYFAVSPTLVAADGLPRAASGGHTQVPGYLIGRLALDQSLQGFGLGGQLLLDALQRIMIAAERTGGRIVVADALDAVTAGFYRRFGFRDTGHNNRLYIKMVTVRQTLGAAI